MGCLNVVEGIMICQVVMGEEDQFWLVGLDAGYGFVCKGDDLLLKNCSGKVLINLLENLEVMML